MDLWISAAGGEIGGRGQVKEMLNFVVFHILLLVIQFFFVF
jgi:hypothetical protein